MTNIKSIENLLWETTPQHVVYGWLREAKEKGYDYVVFAYNKENHHFVPIMCNDLGETYTWASCFVKNEKYANNVLIQSLSEKTLEDIFIASEDVWA